MKSVKRIVLVLAVAVLSLTSVKAGDFDTGLDLTSTYVWRGTAFSGPAIQPYVEYGTGGFSIGAWGSQGFDGFQEMDLYLGYEFDFGLYVGVTDYYYPGSTWGNAFPSDSTGNHAFEINATYSIGSFSLAANFIPNSTVYGAPVSSGGDIYFELGYSFDSGVEVFFGAGDGWHTTNTNFQVVNVGLGYTKEVKITDTFSLPIGGQVILNPNKEQFYVVGTISF